MNKKITINNKELKYKLKRSARARKMRITVNCDASITVTLPNIANENFAENFLREKSQWILKKIEHFKKNESIPKRKFSKNDYKKNKEIAREIIQDKVKNFNDFYKFKFNKISIRNQKTRWGSCSKINNLNFNYKLIYLPEKLADYVVIHEICHLQEFNHSSKFWDLVEKMMPDYRNIRKELRETIL